MISWDPTTLRRIPEATATATVTVTVTATATVTRADLPVPEGY
jgi:hypothetical protein